MSNPQPPGAKPSVVAGSSQLHASRSTVLSLAQKLSRILVLQLLLIIGGIIYAVFSSSLMWVALPMVLGLLNALCLTLVSHWRKTVFQLSQQLHQAEAECNQLVAINQSLEAQLVDQAPLQEQLQQSEATALQAEKMATLGMLTAGVAHEINTPVGAIQASAENLDFSVTQTLKLFPQLCGCLDDSKLLAFAQLLDWADQNNCNLSSRQERQLKRQIKAKLNQLNIANVASIAEILSPMGIEQDLEPLLPILQADEVELILDAAYSLSTIKCNTQNIGIAASRTNNIVASLRNYARKGSQVQPTLGDLGTGLDTVLTLYQNQLKYGIELQKQYDDVPPLRCYPEALDQAWANIIGNAIQAMDGKGKLEIALNQTEDQLQVSIIDSGPGIPPAVQSQIFDPYFTTKPMGKGSGLGLSITQKIIQRHHGQIAVESRPGRTCFQISLPLTGIPKDKDPDSGGSNST